MSQPSRTRRWDWEDEQLRPLPYYDRNSAWWEEARDAELDLDTPISHADEDDLQTVAERRQRTLARHAGAMQRAIEAALTQRDEETATIHATAARHHEMRVQRRATFQLPHRQPPRATASVQKKCPVNNSANSATAVAVVENPAFLTPLSHGRTPAAASLMAAFIAETERIDNERRRRR